MMGSNNTIEMNKVEESNKYSEEFEKQIISMLQRMVPKDIQKVEVVQKSSNFNLTRLKRATTTETTKPDEPQKRFKNPIDKTARVEEISLIPNSAFKTKGKVLIAIDGATIFENEDFADFTDAVDDNVRFLVGKEIDSSHEVEVYIWTSDGTSSSLAVQVTFGE